MSWRYSRWDAPSDRDYDDTCLALPPVVVTCAQCKRLFEVAADEQGPYRCEPCCERNAQIDQLQQDRRIA